MHRTYYNKKHYINKEALLSTHWPLSRELACKFRLYLEIGWTSVKPHWKHCIFASNYHCLHTGVPYNTVCGWNRLNVKAQCTLFTYKELLFLICIRVVHCVYFQNVYPLVSIIIAKGWHVYCGEVDALTISKCIIHFVFY